MDDILIPFHTQKMTLFDSDYDIYRQPPSLAVDAAWDKLVHHGFTYVTETQALRMGWDLSTTVKAPTLFGLGPETHYMGETDMLHKLHCLNVVRKDVFFHYYWGNKTFTDGEPSERHQIHTSHCLYVILQSLICDAHTDLIPAVYMGDYMWPVLDFEINRKCVSFEGVKNWEKEHSITKNETMMRLLQK
jgi:hypothetical protein